MLGIDAPAPLADAVVRGIAATLATSVFAESANLVGVGIDDDAFLDHRHAHVVDDRRRRPRARRHARRHDRGGAAEHVRAARPAHERRGVGAGHRADRLERRRRARRRRRPRRQPRPGRRRRGRRGRRAGCAVVAARRRRAVGARAGRHRRSVPVGLSAGDVAELHAVLRDADAPLVDDEPATGAIERRVADACRAGDAGCAVDADGPSDRTGRGRRRATGDRRAFERSKALELIAWLTLHRDRSTRAGARTALWELDVRDATFANVVSEARRAMARLVEPPAGEEWLGRTLTEVLPLHALVVVRRRPRAPPARRSPGCSRPSWRSRRCGRRSS